MTLSDAAARRDALDLGRHILAVAPAGSGKTGLLVQRMLAALATVSEPEQVVAITFTNKAAAEIRARVLEALASAAEPAPADPFKQQTWALARAALDHARARGWSLREQPERIRAQTIDGFNAAIAAELPLFSGIGGRARMSEDARGLADAAVQGLFERALADGADPPLQQAAAAWLRATGNRLDRLTPALSALLERREQWIDPLFDDAHPDAGDGLLAAQHVAAQSALRQALGSDAEALAALARAAAEAADDAGPLAWARALDGLPAPGPASARQFDGLAQLLITADGSLRKAGGINVRLGFVAKQPATVALKALLDRHADHPTLAAAARQVRVLPPATLPPALTALREHLRVLLKHLLAELRLAMSQRGETDFTEVALAARAALRPEGGYGEALLRRDAQLRHLLVDEMQDTSEAQIGLLAQLTQDWQPGDGRSLFLVGDPQQSIYAFRKADVRLFLRLLETARLGSLALHCLRLDANFRSDPVVVQWVNQQLGPCFPTQPDTVNGEVPFNPSQAQRPAAGGIVSLNGFHDPAAAADATVARARAALSAGASVAVLARSRNHLAPILDRLRSAQLDYACVEVDALAALPGVRDVLACTRALWHPADSLSWLIWLRAPWVGLGWADLLRLSAGRRSLPWPQRLATPPDDLSDDGRQRLTRLMTVLDAIRDDAGLQEDLAARVRAVWTQLGGPDCVASREQADVRRCFGLIHAHSRGGGLRDEAAFSRAIDSLYAQPAPGRLQLMTIHRAKGLEFDEVLLVGCGQGARRDGKPLLHTLDTEAGPLLLPKPPDALAADDPWHRWFNYAQQRQSGARDAETLRLLYVALTRARQGLHLFAHGEPDPDDLDALKLPAASFGGLLQQRFALQGGPSAAAAVEVDLQGAPRAARLPADWQPATDDTPRFRPRERRQLRPSEQVLEGRRAERVDEDLYAQSVGILFHQAMERVADTGIAAWQAGEAQRRQSLQAALFRMGVSPTRVPEAVSRVMTLVQRALTSPIGRALLAPRIWAGAEYPLAGVHEDRWISAVIDRCFETDDALWVIDYKTTATPLAAEHHDAYCADASVRYAAQLDSYRRLLAAHRPGKPVIGAFYFVEPDRLIGADGTALAPPD